MAAIRIDMLESEVGKQLEAVQKMATVALKEAAVDAGEYARKEVMQNSPRDTGKYAKSWRKKIASETSTSIHVEVYSPSRYMLTHLLEYGHAKRGGGRVAARPHIEPAQEAAGEVFVENVMRGLRNG